MASSRTFVVSARPHYTHLEAMLPPHLRICQELVAGKGLVGLKLPERLRDALYFNTFFSFEAILTHEEMRVVPDAKSRGLSDSRGKSAEAITETFFARVEQTNSELLTFAAGLRRGRRVWREAIQTGAERRQEMVTEARELFHKRTGLSVAAQSVVNQIFLALDGTWSVRAKELAPLLAPMHSARDIFTLSPSGETGRAFVREAYALLDEASAHKLVYGIGLDREMFGDTAQTAAGEMAAAKLRRLLPPFEAELLAAEAVGELAARSEAGRA